MTKKKLKQINRSKAVKKKANIRTNNNPFVKKNKLLKYMKYKRQKELYELLNKQTGASNDQEK